MRRHDLSLVVGSTRRCGAWRFNRHEVLAPLEDGEVRLKVDRFAFTANSVT